MDLTEQQRLRDKTVAILFDWAEHRVPPFTGENQDSFADAITAAHLVADEARINLGRWIDAARRSGLSWSEVGDALGISKQAAQQRFKSLDGNDESVTESGEEIVRVVAGAFNEMSVMREEGRKGFELVRTGALMLVFRPTTQRWEYRRLIRLSHNVPPEMEREGWRFVTSWLPFLYYKRAIGPL